MTTGVTQYASVVRCLPTRSHNLKWYRGFERVDYIHYTNYLGMNIVNVTTARAKSQGNLSL